MKSLLPHACALLCCAAAEAAAADVLRPLEPGAVKVGGEMGRRIEATVSNNFLALDLEKDFLAPFQGEPEKRRGAYIGLGKLIDAAVHFAAHTGDERVRARKEELVRAIVATQEEDGYIGTLPPEKRFWTPWDIHEMSYLVLALANDHRFFGKRESLAAARRLADLVIEQWAAKPPSEGKPPWGFSLNLGVTGMDNAMLALHAQTGEARYLDFVVADRSLPEWDGPIVVGRWGRFDGHAYSHLCRCAAQLLLWRRRPDDRLLRPSRDALDFMLRGDGMTVTGEVGDHECWHDTQEGATALGESCATAYLLRWLDELLRLDGESSHGDLMERILCNGLFAAQSPDGRRIRYYSPMEGPRSYHDGDTYCCPNNYRRIVAELPGFVYYRAGDGLAVNLYTASEARLELRPGLAVRVAQETDYPSSGSIVLRLDPSTPAAFPLKLRIPRWCGRPALSVNGDRVADAVAPGGFFTIAREWRPGDRVALDLPMPPRLVKGRAAQAGRVAVLRGPQVFSLNRSANPGLAGADLRQLTIVPETLAGPFPDATTRPGGTGCRVKAWKPGALPQGTPPLTLQLTEFADPAAEITYFKVPNPNDALLVDDELMTDGAKRPGPRPRPDSEP